MTLELLCNWFYNPQRSRMKIKLLDDASSTSNEANESDRNQTWCFCLFITISLLIHVSLIGFCLIAIYTKVELTNIISAWQIYFILIGVSVHGLFQTAVQTVTSAKYIRIRSVSTNKTHSTTTELISWNQAVGYSVCC